MSLPFLKSLHSRLLLVLLGLTALPALLIGGLAYRNARQSIEERVEAQLTSIADLKKEQITTWLDGRAADARLLAVNRLNQEHFTEILSPDTPADRKAEFAAFLTDNLIAVQQARAGYSQIVFMDVKGTVILSADSVLVGKSALQPVAFAETLAAPGGEFMHDIHFEPGTGLIEMDFGHVVYAVDLETGEQLPKVIGAVIIAVDMEETIYPLVRAWPGMGATGETLLVRADGDSTLFLNPLRFDENAALNFRVPTDSPNARPARLAAAGNQGIIQTNDYRGVPVLAAYRAIPQTGWGFVAKEDLAEAFAPVDALARQIISTAAAVLLIAVLISFTLARTLTQPLAQLVGATRAISAGNLTTEISAARNDEIGALAATFREMVAALAQRQQQMRAADEAARSILGTLSLETVLREIARTAQELAGARYAALAVVDERGVAGRFVAVGLPEVEQEALGQIPSGRGLIGLFWERSTPLRLRDLTTHPRAIGFPPGHPPMRSFLGAPILSRERTLGALYLTEKVGADEFTQADEDAIVTLAAYAAVALENARLFDETRQRAGELAVLYAAGRDAAASLELGEVAQRAAKHLVAALDATSAYVLTLEPDSAIATVVTQTVSPQAGADERIVDVGAAYDLRHSPKTLAAMRAGQPFVTYVSDPGADEMSRKWLAKHGGKSALRVPLVVGAERLLGYVVIWESRTEREWTPDEIRLAQTLADQLAVSLENARLFDETRRRLQELDFLHRAVVAATASGTLDDVLGQIVSAVGEMFRSQSVGLFLIDQAAGALVLRAALGVTSEQVAPLRLASGRGITGWVAQTGQPLLVPDVRQDSRYVEGDQVTRAEMSAPLKIEDRVIGVINVESPSVDAFTADDLRLLSTLAGQLATSIERVRALGEAHQRARELAALNEITHAINVNLETTAILRTVGIQTKRLMPVHRASVALLVPDGESLIGYALGADLSTGLQASFTLPVAGSGVGAAIVQREIQIERDLTAERRFVEDEQLLTGGVRAVVRAPLIYQGDVLGTYNLGFAEVGGPDETQLEIIAAIADQIATAVAHARLFEKAERLAAQLRVAAEISRNLGAILDLAPLLQSVSERIMAAFGYEHANVALVEGDEVVFWHGKTGHTAGGPLKEYRLKIGAEGLCGWAAAQRQTVRVGDVTSDPRYYGTPELPDIRSELVVPLIARGELVGLLDVQSEQRHAFDEADQVLMEALAGSLAVAIHNARLFHDLAASYDHTLDALVAALDARDKETEGHSRRVVAYTLALAGRMNIPEDELVTIRRGALLHDIGKIGIPDAILRKPGPLTDDERAIMRRHPQWGEDILSGIRFLEAPAQIVYAHQERWDGAGYPQGLAGEAIPPGARIFAVADAFDAITSDRPYRLGRSYAVARAEIEAGSGTQFDPRAVEAFLQIPEEEWARLRAKALAPPGAAGPFPAGAILPLPPELEALSRLITSVSSSLNLSQVLREAARATVETLGAAASGLFLYETESDSLSLAAEHGLPESLKTRFAHLPVIGFHNESVVREGRPRLIGDIAQVPALVALGLPSLRPDWGQYLCVPLIARGEVNGVLGVFCHRPRAFGERDLRLYQALGEHIGLAIAHARLHESVQHMAMSDSLTGAFNRRYFNEFLAKELQRCARYQHGVSLIMLDLDGFKEYNDAGGHPAGDEALRQLVELLRRNVRAVDVVARYGGEEFAIILPETELPGAHAAAEKIRAAIEAHPFPHGRMTASLGVAHCVAAQDTSPEAFIAMADQALYNAKRRGRNCVCAWEPGLADLPRQTGAIPL